MKVWDAPLRLFHWVLVVAIAIAFLSSEEDSALNNWHVLSADGWPPFYSPFVWFGASSAASTAVSRISSDRRGSAITFPAWSAARRS